MNRYMERSQSFAAARQIACRIRTYGITLVLFVGTVPGLFHVEPKETLIWAFVPVVVS